MYVEREKERERDGGDVSVYIEVPPHIVLPCDEGESEIGREKERELATYLHTHTHIHNTYIRTWMHLCTHIDRR